MKPSWSQVEEWVGTVAYGNTLTRTFKGPLWQLAGMLFSLTNIDPDQLTLSVKLKMKNETREILPPVTGDLLREWENHYRANQDGIVPLLFAGYESDTPAGFAHGINMFEPTDVVTVKVQIGAATQDQSDNNLAPSFECHQHTYQVPNIPGTTEPRVARDRLCSYSVQQLTLRAGKNTIEIDDRGPIYRRILLMSGDIERVTLKVDGVERFDRSRAINDVILNSFERNPAATRFVLDPAESGNLFEDALNTGVHPDGRPVRTIEMEIHSANAGTVDMWVEQVEHVPGTLPDFRLGPMVPKPKLKKAGG